MELLTAFVAGVISSTVAAIFFDRATRAKLEVVCDDGPRAQATLPDRTSQEFHHVVVRNVPWTWLRIGRRPAWACQATVDVLRWTGEPLIEGIRARWSSQPEPISSFVVGDRVVAAVDMAKMIAGRRLDVYGHQPERLVVAIKHAGSPHIHLFSNESYQFEHSRNPDWRLDSGSYRLRVTIHYERGTVHQQFSLRNTGTSLDDVRIEPWKRGTAV